MGVKFLDGRPKKSAIRPFNTRVREVPRRPLLADSRLSHRNIVVQCSESDQMAANGNTDPWLRRQMPGMADRLQPCSLLIGVVRFRPRWWPSSSTVVDGSSSGTLGVRPVPKPTTTNTWFCYGSGIGGSTPSRAHPLLQTPDKTQTPLLRVI